MNTKILASLMIIALVGVVAGAGTFAYFSDTETSTDNTFTAGTLNLKYKVDTDGDSDFSDENWKDGTSAHVTIEDVKPGDSGNIMLPFKVEGSTEGYMDVRIASVTSDEHGRNEPELEVDDTGGDPGEGNGELGKKLELRALGIGGSYLAPYGEPFEDYADSWWCKDLNLAGGADGYTIWGPESGQEYPRTFEGIGSAIEIQWKLPSEVGNVVQGDTLTFDVEFSFDQGNTGIGF